MKAVIAIDPFKGSLTSLEAGEAVRAGILAANPGAEVLVRPLADGREGTVEALTRGMGGTFRTVQVTGPLSDPIEARYGILADGRTAIVEMSAAAGITLVPEEKRNPLHTTTCGVGEILRDAIRQGCRSFVVGIGGSATNDGGIGMLQAPGFGMLDREGQQVSFGAAGLRDLETITEDGVLPEFRDCRFRIACDVTNPLCGAQGCSAVFGPQKGADPDMIRQMDGWLSRYAAISKTVRPRADADTLAPAQPAALALPFSPSRTPSWSPGPRSCWRRPISSAPSGMPTWWSPRRAGWTGRPSWGRRPSAWQESQRSTQSPSSPLRAASRPMQRPATITASMPISRSSEVW
jgi:glycerate kinase